MAELGLKKTLSCTFEEALAKVTAALKSEGFGILTEIDVKDTLRRKLSVDFRPYRILGACNPPLAHKALGVHPDVGLMLPCNVVVYEGDDGHAVVLAVDPMQTPAAQLVPAVRDIAEIVREKLGRVLAQLT